LIDLDGKKFSPVKNSEGGRVKSDAMFTFTQNGSAFSAEYSGEGFSDGHLIGIMSADNTAQLVYHSRADSGLLEAGQARAEFSKNSKGRWQISMNWQWLNNETLNNKTKSGQSFYEEII